MSSLPRSDAVPSPCNDRCELSARSVCLGCGRTADEIMLWTSLSADEQRKVTELARARCAQASGPTAP